MNEHEWLAARFEDRPRLQGVAYRMLGSVSEADDAVQEAWLRLNRADTSDVANLSGWLTTVVARLCLDMLRARKTRREESLDDAQTAPRPAQAEQGNPESEALLADSVGIALLVVLETLAPAERLAFVLHDLFAVPFDEIAPIVDRSPEAARQLASRARRRVQGADVATDADLPRQRHVVEAFLAASRRGDFDALLTLLDPEMVLRSDQAGAVREVHGATVVAKRASRGGAFGTQPALINGAVGAVVAPHGRLLMVLVFTIEEGKIVALEAISDPARLAQIDIAILPD